MDAHSWQLGCSMENQDEVTANLIRFQHETQMNSKLTSFFVSLGVFFSNAQIAFSQSASTPKAKTYMPHQASPDELKQIIGPFYEAVASHDWKVVSKYMFQTAGSRPQRYVYSANLASIPDGSVWRMVRLIAVECNQPEIEMLSPQAYLVFGIFEATSRVPSSVRSSNELDPQGEIKRTQTSDGSSPTVQAHRVDLWLKRADQWVVIPDGEIPNGVITIANLPSLSDDARIYEKLDDVHERDRKDRELRKQREKAIADTIADIKNSYSAIKKSDQLIEADRIAKLRMKALRENLDRINEKRDNLEQVEQNKQIERLMRKEK